VSPPDATPDPAPPVGATPTSAGTHFEVWAPWAGRVEVRLEGGPGADLIVPLAPAERPGRWAADIDGVGHGDRYRFALDGGDPLADPASRWQPDGVHGASAVVDPRRFHWTDAAWKGVALGDAVIYELHVGAFTPEGTFDAATGQLDRLAALGVTLVELMPVAPTPGRRNWGYDGVFPAGVNDNYGGPAGLARFVDAAHARGIGVLLDVVYNHLGPEGNIFGRYGPYFDDRTHTPWGDAINVAGAGSDEVRDLFVQSAVQWIADHHVDGLRLDAVDAIVDPTARPFLEELTAAVHAAGEELGRRVLVIAETASNDPRLVASPAVGGVGVDALWNDDVHHCLHVALLGDRCGYYADYDGSGDLATALAHRWVFAGHYSVFRGRRHGRSADHVAHRQLVVFSANHDHVGNTPDGRRPPLDRAPRLVAAATVLLTPFTPLLFMGEEYAEPAPFPFFVDPTDAELLEATRAGRRAEFARAGWDRPIADPGDEATFRSAVLDPGLSAREPHRTVLAAHTELLALRRRLPILTDPRATHEVRRHGDAVLVERRLGRAASVLALNMGAGPLDVTVDPRLRVAFDSDAERWGGPGTTSLEAGRLWCSSTAAVLLVTD
jgi:maltooligosyltrehalose trehalohydrolase